MKLSSLKSLLVLVVLASATLATQHALAQNTRALSGDYTLEHSCRFNVIYIGDVEIPAGKITVTEDVPLAVEQGASLPSIIFQTENTFRPVPTLGVGKIAPFEY